MPRTLYSPIALAKHLASAVTPSEHLMGGAISHLYACPLRLSDGSPCPKFVLAANGAATAAPRLEEHLLVSHNLNSRKGGNWRDAHDNAARLQGCKLVWTFGDVELAAMNEWPAIVTEARVGHFLHGRHRDVAGAGFTCERIVWRSAGGAAGGATYVMVDAGLYAVLAPAFDGTPTRAEAIRLGHMILAEAAKCNRSNA